MGTLNVIYVHVADQRMAAAILATYPAASTEAGTSFWAIHQADDHFECPEAELQQLSQQLGTDVIWLSFQSVVDAFQYYYWRDGVPVRALVYGCFKREREWERVEGLPQEWEAAVLFDPARFQRSLKHRSEAERAELQRLYRERGFSAAGDAPSIDAREAARGVATFYRFPGWSPSGEDAE